MADSNLDLCNPLATWEALITFLLGTSATASPPTPGSVPRSIRPPFLREPDFIVRRTAAGRFQLGKPNYGVYDTEVLPSSPLTVIQEFATEAEANALARKLPRVRLPAVLVREMRPDLSFISLPSSAQFNWTSDADAQNTAGRLDAFLTSVPVAASLPTAPQVTLNLAKLPEGVQALHIPHPSAATRSLILVDPFKISEGTLQLCAAYVHELTHAQRHQARGFDRHELTSLLSRDDYVLLGLDEELAGFKNGVTAVKQFLASVPAGQRPPFAERVVTVLDDPVRLYFASGLASMPPATVEALAHKVVGDSYLLSLQNEYDDLHAKSLVPSAAANAWISSPDWAAIQATLPAWQAAGVL